MPALIGSALNGVRRLPPYMVLPSVAAAAWGIAALLTEQNQVRSKSITEAASAKVQRPHNLASAIPLYMPRTLDQAAAATPSPPPDSAALTAPIASAPGSAASIAGGGGGSSSSAATATSASARKPEHPLVRHLERQVRHVQRQVRRVERSDEFYGVSSRETPPHEGLSPHAGQVRYSPGVWRRIEDLPDHYSEEERREFGIPDRFVRNADGTYSFNEERFNPRPGSAYAAYTGVGNGGWTERFAPGNNFHRSFAGQRGNVLNHAMGGGHIGGHAGGGHR